MFSATHDNVPAQLLAIHDNKILPRGYHSQTTHYLEELAECTRREEGVEKDKSLLFVFEVLLIFLPNYTINLKTY